MTDNIAYGNDIYLIERELLYIMSQKDGYQGFYKETDIRTIYWWGLKRWLLMYKKKITIRGNKVQDVGYRLFLLDEAERMLITHLDAKNLNKENIEKVEEKVEVLIGGDKDRVGKFVEFIKNNFPEQSDVDKPIGDAENYEGDIRTIESFSRCLSVHQLTKFAVIGTKIVAGQDKLRIETNENFGKMNDNFTKMDVKYDKISNAMFATVGAIEKRNQILEKRMDNTDKNIEKLLEILIQQKK